MKTKTILPLLFAMVAACSSNAAKSTSATSAATASPAVHGMVLFGTDTLYINHIPMFMAPHDYQALLEVKLSASTTDATAFYLKANGSGEQNLFTLQPKPFVLPSLLNGNLKSFTADLYQGDFENGGRRILSNVTVTVQEVDYAAQLKKTTTALKKLTYLPLASGDSTYLVHQISAPSNFEHIVQVEWLNGKSTSVAKLPAFAVADTEANRLQVGDVYNVTAIGIEKADSDVSLFSSHVSTSALPVNNNASSSNSDETSNSSDSPADSESAVSFKVVSDFYCSEGPDFFNPCN